MPEEEETDADEALRRYRANPSPTPAPPVSENVRSAEVTKGDDASGDDASPGHVVFYLEDGRFVGVPLAWSWRLLEATEEERQDFEVDPSGYGVRWPAVDEDLSGRGALRGIPSPRPRSDSEEISSSDSPKMPRPSADERGSAEGNPSVSWTAPRIGQLRQRLGLSQTEMAERMGVRQATISDWEQANQNPSPMACRLLDQLAKA